MYKEVTDSAWFRADRLWQWARQHPGTVMVGALLLAFLLVPHSQAKNRPIADFDADETPLFI